MDVLDRAGVLRCLDVGRWLGQLHQHSWNDEEAKTANGAWLAPSLVAVADADLDISALCPSAPSCGAMVAAALPARRHYQSWRRSGSCLLFSNQPGVLKMDGTVGVDADLIGRA